MSLVGIETDNLALQVCALDCSVKQRQMMNCVLRSYTKLNSL